MLSGSKGMKYGLQLPAGKKRAADVRTAKPKAVSLKKPAIFAEESDEEDVEAEIARQAAKKRSDKELEQQHAAALKEDPNVFDYDGVYDQMKEAQARPTEQQQAQRQPRYIEALLKKAKERERTQEMVMERKIQKEQAAEAHLYGDKEKFVTGAYKRKLAEDAKWREEERRREEVEAAHDVTAKTDLSDFYRNLLNKNEAFGAGARSIAVPARETPPSTAADNRATAQERATNDVNDDTTQESKEALEDPMGAARKSSESESLKERSLERERERIREVSDGGQEGAQLESGEEQAGNVVSHKQKGSQDVRTTPGVNEERGASSERATKTDAVAEAKARYLARKRQRT
ncbi:hypothetical protein KFL_006120030 [Klebsormidium nitens]|uniref:Nuclear speckle splicing regulatory protein 1 N-terminal domain-containing protein n=1 Tax=Klebsormidium nitens TaxID=105231 RepID=A0A1Y1IL80_KLENI|nr:hypothetical protein KFL_006120030 [Klebsormidium nitens]|eukprot:GAQ90199.1 hypothetical protein KFL_006120030 [Klebsormidium nitens]